MVASLRCLDVAPADVAPVEPVSPAHCGHRAAQRGVDLVVALVGGLILLVPGLLIAVAVVLTSPGPWYFKQRRVGANGEHFEVIKFRTMVVGTHEQVVRDEVQREAYEANDFKLSIDDPRITRVGRFLRRSSIDEIPQFLNVLRGEMSVVGIRPLLPDELARRPDYDQALYRGMRPGMTGLWQVEGRSTVQQVDRVALDRRYLEDWRVWDDVKIMLRTPAALVRTGDTR